jgi:hypothetical protein
MNAAACAVGVRSGDERSSLNPKLNCATIRESDVYDIGQGILGIAKALRGTYFKIEDVINNINLAITGNASLFLIVEPGLASIFDRS